MTQHERTPSDLPQLDLPQPTLSRQDLHPADDAESNPQGGGANPVEGDEFDEAMIGQLLRQGEPRPPVPAVHWAQARTAAEAAWRQQVERRRRRRLGGLGLAMAAAVTWWAVSLGPQVGGWLRSGQDALTAASSVSSDGGVLARLEVIRGDVQWQSEVSGTLQASRRLQPLARLEGSGWLTTDDHSRAALRLVGGQSLRLDVGTRLRLASRDVLWLESGAVYVDSTTDAPLEVRTAHGVARDIGTQFEVRMQPAGLRLRVREGKVVLRQGEEEHLAEHGVELRLDDHGVAQRVAVEVTGEIWDWSLGVAPPFELEGSTLQAFLGWVTRENGWRLRYADSSLDVQSTSIQLHGSLQGVPIGDATAMVLATCGLDHELQDGVLVVRRP